MFRRVGDVGLDGDRGFVLGMDWRGASIDGLATLLEVLLDKSLFVVLVNDRLAIGDKGSHVEDNGCGMSNFPGDPRPLPSLSLIHI